MKASQVIVIEEEGQYTLAFVDHTKSNPVGPMMFPVGQQSMFTNLGLAIKTAGDLIWRDYRSQQCAPITLRTGQRIAWSSDDEPDNDNYG